MAGYVILGMLAAFGLFSALWVMLGWLIPGGRGSCLICTGDDIALAQRLWWLRELGVIRCPICVTGENLSSGEIAWLMCHGIEIRGPMGPELEREKVDGTGNGDPTGRDQRRGISEL